MPSSATAPAATMRRFYLRWPFALAVVAAIAYGVAFLMHWDDRGMLWVKEHFETTAERGESVWLPDYKVEIDAKPLPGMADDEASDLAFNPSTRTLFSVMGKKPILTELNLDGDVLRNIPLKGWANPEGVTVMEGGYMAITDERLHDLTVVKVDASTTELNHADFQSHDLGLSENGNKGYEAVVWDPRRQRLVLGEERPPRLYEWSSNGQSLLSGNKTALPTDPLDLRNLSALGIDPRTGHLLALSADSHMLLELNDKGEKISFMTVLGGFNGLQKTIPRAEGVAMDDQGTLYIISEPALFYRFKKG